MSNPLKIIDLGEDAARAAAAMRRLGEEARRAEARVAALKGSLVWITSKGADYLVRAAWDGRRRRQTSLGRRGPETEAAKAAFDRDRTEARIHARAVEAEIARSARIARAHGLGRVPVAAARVIRALEAEGLFEHGWRIGGPTALLAYEAAAGGTCVGETEAERAFFDEAKRRLVLIATTDPGRALLDRLRRVDRGFRPVAGGFANGQGFSIEIVGQAGERAASSSVRAEALGWVRRSRVFTAEAFDAKGVPVRLSAPDPRVLAGADLMLAGDLFRDPVLRPGDDLRGAATVGLLGRGIVGGEASAGLPRAMPREAVAALTAALGGRGRSSSFVHGSSAS